ncbi:hypothetical protein Vi05172_g11404 [Venturia inaequalis]|nr:hypothetical protein Vi05172_g11404 [Venturia inaequalis]
MQLYASDCTQMVVETAEKDKGKYYVGEDGDRLMPVDEDGGRGDDWERFYT